MENFSKNILITGGAGFIGSHAVRYFIKKYPNYRIINLDALTYAGNLNNLADIANEPNYKFVRADIRDKAEMEKIFKEHEVSDVIHFAAESHVDRSITNPLEFVETNVLGTCILLNLANHFWSDSKDHIFYHVSTDEVYGSLGKEGFFVETTPYDPRSPYSASKASSDHFVRAYQHTFGLPVVLSNCSNNYGPFQFPEKLIPLMINNILHEKPLPVYGDGTNIRDWLFVTDHVIAIDRIFQDGKVGETYNIGGNNELKNIDLVHVLCDLMDKKLGRENGSSRKLVTFVKDRPGHDQRYAIDASKIKNELGWEPTYEVNQGMSETIDWYLEHKNWLEQVTSGNYKKYYETHYGG